MTFKSHPNRTRMKIRDSSDHSIKVNEKIQRHLEYWPEYARMIEQMSSINALLRGTLDDFDRNWNPPKT